MKIIQLPRAAGKTYKLVTLSAERNAPIVCRDNQEAKRIYTMAQAGDLDIPFPHTYAQFSQKDVFRGRNYKELMIDDVDQLLMYISKMNISYATYTPS